ncbi:uncharacterized protein [Cicer arietinum]|uniref:uncharacterized protein isoform X2 n=1 Tax=Cicer arietinum TaxID=3827 RepID=UPI003CC67CBF
MDRYQKVEKPKPESPINENEIRITTQGAIRNYITYASSLLQEKNAKEIVLKAMGQAISKTVAIAEILKKRIPRMHQDTAISSVSITDVWEPIEEGLVPVEMTRHVSMISITLSTRELDKNSPGYQAPSNVEQPKPYSNYPQQPIKPAQDSYNAVNEGIGYGGGRGEGGRGGAYEGGRGGGYEGGRGGGGYEGGRGGGGYESGRGGGGYEGGRGGGSYESGRGGGGYEGGRGGGYEGGRGGGYDGGRGGGYGGRGGGYDGGRGGGYEGGRGMGYERGRGGGMGYEGGRGGGGMGFEGGRGGGRGFGRGRGRMGVRGRGGVNQA